MTADIGTKGEIPCSDGKYFFSKYAYEENDSVVSITESKKVLRRSSSTSKDDECMKPDIMEPGMLNDDTTIKRSEDLETTKAKSSFTCSFCRKSFYTRWTLKRHVMSHTGEKPHSCDICCKSFASKWQLELHYRVHTGEKPYPCEICSKRFTTKSHLSRHRRTHSKNRSRRISDEATSYVNEMSELSLNESCKRKCASTSCDASKKQSHQKTDKLRLKHTKSDQGTHSCSFCRKQFTTMSKLKLHQHIVHPRVLFVYGLTHIIYV